MLLTHVQAKGRIEILARSENKGFFRFYEAIVGQREKEAKEFKNERSFHAYLASRKDVDSWVIKHDDTQRCFYKYRNCDGTIEHFDCEEDLYRELSEKNNGAWKLVATWRDKSALQPIYMLDESTLTTRSYGQYSSLEAFQVARVSLELEDQYNEKLSCIIS